MSEFSRKHLKGLGVPSLASSRAMTILRPRLKRTPEEWVSHNRRYDETTGRPGPRDVGHTPYTRIIHAFFDTLAASARGVVVRFAWASRYSVCVFITGTQSGKTDTALDVIGWRLGVRPRPSLYVGPSKEFVTEIVEDRLTKMLGSVAALRVDEIRSTKRLKYVNGVRVRLAWGGSPASLASDQAGDIIVDEYDKMFRAQRRAGDPYVLALARGDTYADRKMLVTSTPEQGKVDVETDPKSGIDFWAVGRSDLIESRIWRRFQAGTRHHAVWQCPHCQSWFVPRLRNLGWRKESTAGDMIDHTWMVCPASGCVIEETSKEDMNADVRFVAPGQVIRSDGSIEGEPMSTDVLSVWVSGLMSPFVSWGKRAADLKTAELSGEPEAIQGVYNSAGECWSPIDVKQASTDDVLAKVVNYSIGSVPREIIRVSAGVDVQGTRLVYVVRGWGSLARSWLLDRNEIFGRTSEPEVWAKLALLSQRIYGGLRIEKMLVDAGFRPDKREAGDYHKVLDFCRRHPWVATATRGKTKQSVPVISRHEEVTAEGKSEKYGLDVLSVDTDYFKSLWLSRLFTRTGDPGSAHLPIDIAGDGGDYLKQVVSEMRGEDGIWHQVTRQNHYLDAEVLASVGAYMLKVQSIPEGSFRTHGDEDVVKPETESAKAGKSLKDRMAEMSARFNK